MSETIWFEPASERTVFLQIKTRLIKDEWLQAKLLMLKAKGYQVVTSDKVHRIQANVLADKMTIMDRRVG